MDNTVLDERLREICAISKNPGSHTRHLFMENCSGDEDSENITSALLLINTDNQKVLASQIGEDHVKDRIRGSQHGNEEEK